EHDVRGRQRDLLAQVGLQHTEPAVDPRLLKVRGTSARKVVDPLDLPAIVKEAVDQVRAQEPRCPGYERGSGHASSTPFASPPQENQTSPPCLQTTLPIAIVENPAAVALRPK